MATGPQSFYCLWQKEAIRERLFELLSKEDICALRVANSACCNLVTKRLFLRTNLTFTANTFTKPSRIQALSRIGHHIEHLSFNLAHSDATFLPPLIHPQTGREICFLYTPHTSMASVLARPKYGNSDLGDILTQQYPPLFHAATNVPSFINALRHLRNMRHLTIKTPGQHPKERYRRDIVDYALISLRIALEHAPLVKLSKLSLAAVHPSAFNYLRPVPGYGSSPSSTRRWHQIRKLYITVESWDFYGASPGLDHLKIIDDYIRIFAPQLDKFCFTWLGRKGPCPLALSADPLFSPPRSAHKLFAEVTSPMSPLPARPSRRPLHMPRVRYLQVRNATMNVAQLRDLLNAHKRTVKEFDFENVVLINNGSWDEALSPLKDNAGNSDVWSRRSVGGSDVSFRQVPGLSRSRSSNSGSGSRPHSSRGGGGEGDELLPSSSAAALAASKELFEVDLDGMAFGGVNDADVDALEAGVEAWARGVTAAAQQEEGLIMELMAPVKSEEEQKAKEKEREETPLPPDVEAAKQASVEGVSTKLKKRRLRKKPSGKHHRRDGVEPKAAAGETASDRRGGERHQRSRSHSRSRSRSHRKNGRGGEDARARNTSRQRSQSRRRQGSHTGNHHSRHRRRNRSAEPRVPGVSRTPPIPEVFPSDDERVSPRTRKPPTPRPDMGISAPILKSDPLPVMLQPTIYDPSAKTGPFVGNPSTLPPPPPPRLPLPPSSSGPTPPPLAKTPSIRSLVSSSTLSRSFSARAAKGKMLDAESRSRSVDDGLSAVQRSIEAELLKAEAEERSSALRKAKETVLAKLSREFTKRKPGPGGGGGGDGSSGGSAGGRGGGKGGKGGGGGSGGSGGIRRKESAAVMGLAMGFSGAARSKGGGAASLGGRLFGHRVAHHKVSVSTEHRSIESQSALVPLVFSRS